MGSSSSKERMTPREENDMQRLKEKLRKVQKEMRELMGMREAESRAYEQQIMAHVTKEEEWKRERKRLRDEVKRLRKRLEEREERMAEKENLKDGGDKEDNELGWKRRLVEQMREETARRDEAVSKWKQLYLAIKIELDDLIQRTRQGEKLFWRGEEEAMVEDLKREVKAKEEIIEILQGRIASMEHEEYKRKREMDLMKQSLRIMTHKKKQTPSARSLSMSFRWSNS
ncbi:hypothetical protein NMG60_11031881 [Bertholletia excelsa]